MNLAEIRRVAWWAAGVALALTVIFAIGYGTRLGWFGVGLIGLLMLLISVRVDLEADQPGTLNSHGTSELNLATRYLSERSRVNPEERLALIAARQKRRRILGLVRCMGLVLTVVGFGLFVQQQL